MKSGTGAPNTLPQISGASSALHSSLQMPFTALQQSSLAGGSNCSSASAVMVCRLPPAPGKSPQRQSGEEGDGRPLHEGGQQGPLCTVRLSGESVCPADGEKMALRHVPPQKEPELWHQWAPGSRPAPPLSVEVFLISLCLPP